MSDKQNSLIVAPNKDNNNNSNINNGNKKDDPPMKNFCLYFLRFLIFMTVLMLLVTLSVYCLHVWISYEADALELVEKMFIFASDIGLAGFVFILIMAELGCPREFMRRFMFLRRNLVRGCALLWMGAMVLGTAVQGEVIAQGAVAVGNIKDDARKALLIMGYIGGWGCVAMGAIHLIGGCLLPASFEDEQRPEQQQQKSSNNNNLHNNGNNSYAVGVPVTSKEDELLIENLSYAVGEPAHEARSKYGGKQGFDNAKKFRKNDGMDDNL